jgi:hypothetical protein
MFDGGCAVTATPNSSAHIITPDAAAMPDWGEKLRLQNMQVLRAMQLEKQQARDALREHGDRVQFDEIKNTSIGK